jgi:hypothetical protein
MRHLRCRKLKERSVPIYNLDVKVVGIDRVRKNLTKLDGDIGKTLTKEVRASANILRDEARSLIPSSAPLSNWQGSGRAMPSRLPYWDSSSSARSQIKSSIGEGSRQRGTYRRGAVARVTSSNPAAVVFDKAGDSAGSSVFVSNLVSKHGPKKRALLKAGDNSRDKVIDQITDAVERAVSKYRQL